MNSSWQNEFGFKQNPYDTRALMDEQGNRLLFGRDDQVRRVTELLTSTSRISVLMGDNGVGKSSIANIAAYRIIRENKSSHCKYFSIILNAMEYKEGNTLLAFKKYLYWKILLCLVDEVSFLKKHGISNNQIQQVKRTIKDLFQGGGTIWVFSAQYQSNPHSEDILFEIANDWLSKCFHNSENGGIICILDNIETVGTSKEVQNFLESARDTLFSITGLSWILCGTPVALKDALSSKILDGYLTPFEIQPFKVDDAKKLIEYRIEKCQISEKPFLPVDGELFQSLYDEMNCQLRTSLSLCEEFAEHLFHYPHWRSENRTQELRKWLDQRAAELPRQAHEIDSDTWSFFDNVTMLGAVSIQQSDYQLYNVRSTDDYKKYAETLERKGLLEQIKTNENLIYRVTKDGWLVHYRRNREKDSITNLVSPCQIPNFTCQIQSQDQLLSEADYEKVYLLMQNGGLCILPSDSSYILTGIPTIPGVTEAINAILNRNEEKMSLAFNNIEQVANTMQISNMAYHFIKKLTPGALTFVARLSNNGYANLSARRLYTDGTIGIRLTESPVETQLAQRFPLPTTPIRNDEGKEVSSIDVAISIIKNRVSHIDAPHQIEAICGEVPYCGRLSTVVKEVYENGFWYIKILREGAIQKEIIEKVAVSCKYRGII